MDKKHILITRPDEQGKLLAEQCNALNFATTRLPLFKITPIFVDPLLFSTNNQHYNMVIFISPNAIKYGLKTVNKLFKYDHTAVVGKSSLALLEANKVVCSIYPATNYTSEGLLNHPMLQDVAKQNILIVKGNAGRKKLKNTLQQRGANVDCLEVYQRQTIEYSKTEQAKLAQTPINLVQISNQQSLDCLIPLVKNAPWFTTSQWWLLSERTKKSCIQYGIKEPMCKIIKPGNDAFIKNL